MAVTEATALYNALAMLTQQVQIRAERGSQRGSGGGGRFLDHYDSFKSLKIFSGDAKDFRGVVSQAQEPGRSSRYQREQADEVGGGSFYRRAVSEGVVQGVADFVVKT